MRKGSIIFIIITLLLFTLKGFSAPNIYTTVNSKKIGTNDLLVVTYSFKNLRGIEGISVPEQFGAFYQIGAQQRMVNNTDFDYIITLQPTKTGKFIIPGATALARGVSYQTNSVSVEVVNGSILKNNKGGTPQRRNNAEDEIERMQQMMRDMMGFDEDFEKEMDRMVQEQRRRMEEMYRRQNGMQGDIGDLKENIFVIATVDKTKVYTGQPINVTYKLYNRAGFTSGNITKLPELKGFYSKDYDIPMPPQEKLEKYKGKDYGTFLIKKAQLFPTQSGKLILDPMEFTAQSPYYGQVRVASDPIVIQVLPIPVADSNIGYTGGVGRFSISQSLDKNEITTDDIATLKITISGTGNVDLIKAPRVVFPEELLPEEARPSSNAQATQNEVQTKEFTINFSAIKAGDYTIPSYKFSYFDVEQGKFVTINTEPLSIKVKEGKLRPTERPSSLRKNLPLQEINTSPLLAQYSNKYLPEQWWYWVLVALIMTSFPAAMLYNKNKNKYANDAHLYRKAKANKIAQARLKTAQSLINNPDSTPFYEEISKAIGLYISDKFNIPLSDLNKEVIKEQLLKNDVDLGLLDKTISVINESEMALYSPLGGAMQKDRILSSAIEVIEQLEERIQLKAKMV